MDHLWLDAVERAAPAVQEAFLTPGERGGAARRGPGAGARRAAAGELRARSSRTCSWGTRALDAERQERLRQFLAGRGELTAGPIGWCWDAARQSARAAALLAGASLLALGAGGALALARRPR